MPVWQLVQRVVKRTARVGVGALTLLALSASVARADERTGSDVDVTIVGSGDPALEASISELLTGLHLSTHFARVEAERASDGSETSAREDLIALVQLDLGREGALGLRIVDPRRRRVLVRELPIPQGIDEIVREEVSHIVVYTVEAIARGEDIGEPQPPPKERAPARAPSPTRPPARAMALELETNGAVRTYASVVPAVLGTGAALALSTERGGIRVGGALAFEQRSAIIVTTQPVAARFAQRSLRISVVGEMPIASGIAFRTSAGAALDVVDVSTTPLRPTSEPRRRAFVDALPVLDVAGGLRVELVPRLAAIATAGIELPLATSDYVVEDTRGRDFVLLSPHSLRLVGRLGIGVRF